MMPDEVLAIVVQKLDDGGIAYMITGSYASNTHGAPRTTNDADIVIEIDNPGIAQLSKAFGDDFYFDVKAAQDAVNVAKVQAKNLDFEYLRYWAADLHIETQLNKLLQEIEPLR